MGPQFDISTILLTLIIWKLPKRGVGSTAPPPPSSPDYQSDLENRFYGPNNPQFDISTILLTLIIWKLQKEGWIWKLQKEGWGAPPSPPPPPLLIVNQTSKMDSTAQKKTQF